MSIDRCKNCSAMVDTDSEPEAYSLTTENGEEIQLDYCLCSSCREDKDVEDRVKKERIADMGEAA